MNECGRLKCQPGRLVGHPAMGECTQLLVHERKQLRGRVRIPLAKIDQDLCDLGWRWIWWRLGHLARPLTEGPEIAEARLAPLSHYALGVARA